MASLLPVPKARFFSSNGAPLAGGKVYTYVAGTTTPLATYTTFGGTSANTNPVILDANGEANIWLTGASYKIVLKNSADVTQWTVDNVSGQPLATYVTLEDYGAVGDGATDDSNAAALAFATGKPVFLGKPSVAYVLGDVAVPSGASMIAFSGQSYSTLLAKPIVRRKSGATTVFALDGSKVVRFSGFCIDGVDRVTDGITGDSSTGHITLDFMDIRNCNYGIGDSSYIRTVKAVGCNFYGNNIGIRNPIDSIFIDCYVAANLTNGASCTSGANSNTFTACKFEWNEGQGIDLFDCARNVIVGCIFDRNYKNGVRIAGSTISSFISGCQFWRNGRNDVAGERAHIRFEGTGINNQVTSCYTSVGQDDGGTGTITPQFCIDFASASNNYLLINGNDLYGYTSSAVNGSTSIVDLMMTNNFGVNDVATTTTPTVPATTVAFKNPYGRPCFVAITGGTVTAIKIDTITMSGTSGNFYIGPCHSISITYTVAPSWTWVQM